MYLVKVKLKISKKEKKRLDESILVNFSRQNVFIDLGSDDKLSISYSAKSPDYSSYSSAISFVNEISVKKILISVFGDNIFNFEKTKIDSITIEDLEPTPEIAVEAVGDHHGLFNVKYGKLTFCNKMLIKDLI